MVTFQDHLRIYRDRIKQDPDRDPVITYTGYLKDCLLIIAAWRREEVLYRLGRLQ